MDEHLELPEEPPALLPLPFSFCMAFASTGRFALGWDQAKGFYVFEDRVLGRSRTLHSFRLNDAGWAEAWQTMRAKYPSLAEAVVQQVHRSVEPQRHAVEAEDEWRRELDRAGTLAVVTGCTLLGGHGLDVGLTPGTECTLTFTGEGLLVHQPYDHIVLLRSPYATAAVLELSGPGRERKTAGVFGGGFGVTGALEGMVAATVLNTLTSRTTIKTIIRYQAEALEAFFHCSSETPQELRVRLSKVLSLISPPRSSSYGGGSPSVADELTKLAALRDSGVLTDEEFAVQKARLLGPTAPPPSATP